jgi:hypothetical protein
MFPLSLVALGVRATAFDVRLADLFGTGLDSLPMDQRAGGPSIEQAPFFGYQFGLALISVAYLRELDELLLGKCQP